MVQIPVICPGSPTQRWQAPLHAVLQHTPSTQKPERQSQLPAHVVPNTRFGAQLVPVHELVESHWFDEQLPEQLVLQALEPLQVNNPQLFSGSVPAGWLLQVPMKPVRLHATHEPVHALLQHTPSTHWPELHSQVLLHEAPLLFFPVQLEPEQYAPGSHWVLEQPPEQLVLHTPEPLQPKRPHAFSGSCPAL